MGHFLIILMIQNLSFLFFSFSFLFFFLYVKNSIFEEYVQLDMLNSFVIQLVKINRLGLKEQL